MKNNIIKELKLRKLIEKISDEKKIKKILNNKNNNIYCGFDPNNDSLHIGHLIPLITLKRFLNLGYKPIILIGSFTSIIGDPSFRYKKRKKYNENKIKTFSKKIIKQIKNIISNKIKILQNIKWFENMKIKFFLKKIGKIFIINNMLNKKSIKKRNIKKYHGITFTELSYPILQSYDFLYLFKKENVKIQIGGSDQWGNIISGINLIKKKLKKKSFGITLPLITKKNGKKLSKSENNNDNIIWLDPKKTTPYEFYQFWLNINDNKINEYFKQFTFLKIKKINDIIKNKNIKEKKEILAKKITEIVHGKKKIKNIIDTTKFFFKKKIKKITKKQFIKLFKNEIPKLSINNNIINLKEIIILLKIVKTKSQAHNLICNKTIKINNKKITNYKYNIKKKDKLFNTFTIIKKGKKNFFLIKWINN